MKKLNIVVGLVVLFFFSNLLLSQELIGVKIFYSDKTVKIDAMDLAVKWSKTPDDDVQVVNLYYLREGEKRFIVDEMSAHDFYWWSPTKEFGQTNEVKDIPKDAHWKSGKWMQPDEAFLELYNKAHNDKNF